MRYVAQIAHCLGIVCALALGQNAALASGHSSANYSIPADSIDVGGGRVSQGVYVQDGTLGGCVAAGLLEAGVYSVRQGFAGQLHDLVSLQAVASPTTVSENATRQLSSCGTFDDDSAGVLPGHPSWRVVSGLIDDVDTNGLATAGAVYQDTPAVVEASYDGMTATVQLLVLNVLDDNFGSYSGDHISDDWQVRHFGEENPDAAPDADPDEDGQDNLFEFIAGLLPTNSVCRFDVRLEPGAALDQFDISFEPAFTDRAYQVQFKADLAEETWLPVSNMSEDTNGLKRTASLLSVTNDAGLYRVRIEYDN